MDKSEKIANPVKFYTYPDEVKNDETLTADEQIRLLENWLDDIIRKQVAEDENMLVAGKPVPDLTDRVLKELQALKDSVAI